MSASANSSLTSSSSSRVSFFAAAMVDTAGCPATGLSPPTPAASATRRGVAASSSVESGDKLREVRSSGGTRGSKRANDDVAFSLGHPPPVPARRPDSSDQRTIKQRLESAFPSNLSLGRGGVDGPEHQDELVSSASRTASRTGCGVTRPEVAVASSALSLVRGMHCGNWVWVNWVWGQVSSPTYYHSA